METPDAANICMISSDSAAFHIGDAEDQAALVEDRAALAEREVP
jgi:hypothetical protein